MILSRGYAFLTEPETMLSKCANPECGVKFQYLSVGKLFAVEYRGDVTDSEFLIVRDRLRYFWLCPVCSRSMTIQASSAGGVRLATAPRASGANRAQSADGLPSQPEELVSTPDPVWGCNMVGTKSKLEALEKELQFLDNGGYRQAMGWRPPLVFEDSPICPKPSSFACPHAQCVLLDFVPEEQRDQIIPCRHIPLNEAGETLHTLYNTGSMEEIENVLREWLKRKIAELEQGIRSEPVLSERKAG
jgi:hypothetical protein